MNVRGDVRGGANVGPSGRFGTFERLKGSGKGYMMDGHIRTSTALTLERHWRPDV